MTGGRQLSIAGLEPASPLVHREHLRGDIDVVVELRVDDVVVELALRTDTPAEPSAFRHFIDAFVIRIELVPMPRCLVNGTRMWWNLAEVDVPDGPFASAIEWALTYLTTEPDDLGVTSPHHETLGRLCRLAAQYAVAACDPTLRAAALRLAPAARLTAYAALDDDHLGRIQQLLDVCPGLFTLAAGEPTAELELIELARAGAPLSSIIRHTLIARRLAAHPFAAVLVRLAPPRVSCDTLSRVIALPGRDINDLPSYPEDREVWFRWLHAWDRVTVIYPDRRDPRFTGFLSRHALALDAIAKQRTLDCTALMYEIADWAWSDDGTIPTRHSSALRVVEAVDAWHARLWSQTNLPSELTLATGPNPSHSIAGVEARSLVTVGELVREGAGMRHCVASRARLAIAGEQFLYSAKVHGQRVTIAVAPAGDRFRLVEASGFANRRPDHLTLISQWVEALVDEGNDDSCAGVSATRPEAVVCYGDESSCRAELRSMGPRTKVHALDEVRDERGELGCQLCATRLSREQDTGFELATFSLGTAPSRFFVDED